MAGGRGRRRRRGELLLLLFLLLLLALGGDLGEPSEVTGAVGVGRDFLEGFQAGVVVETIALVPVGREEGGWVDWVEEKEAVRMRCWMSRVGEWVGGWMRKDLPRGPGASACLTLRNPLLVHFIHTLTNQSTHPPTLLTAWPGRPCVPRSPQSPFGALHSCP